MPVVIKRGQRNPTTGRREVVEVDLTPGEEAARNADIRTTAQGAAIDRTRERFMALLQSDFPDIETLDEARSVLGSVFRATVPSARSSKLVLAVSRYQYARVKVAEILSMTTAQADSYDPGTDPDWP